MGKAAVMSLLERQKVDFLHSQGLSNRNIAKQINRSSRTVHRYFKDPEAYGNNFKGTKRRYQNKQYAKLLELLRIRLNLLLRSRNWPEYKQAYQLFSVRSEMQNT